MSAVIIQTATSYAAFLISFYYNIEDPDSISKTIA